MSNIIRKSLSPLLYLASSILINSSTGAVAAPTDECEEKSLSAHSLIVMNMLNSMLKYNPQIKSQEALVKAAKSNFLARKTFYYPNLKLETQPLLSYQQSGYSDIGSGIYTGTSGSNNSSNNSNNQINPDLITPYNYAYQYNQLLNFTGQIETDIVNLPKFNLMQSSWNQLKSAQESLSNVVNDTGLQLLNAYITAQSLNQALIDEQKVVDVYKNYTDTQQKLLQQGFSSILEYNNQLGNYLTFQSRVNNSQIRFQQAVDEIYQLSAFRLTSNDFIPLPSPSCLPQLRNIDQLTSMINKYYQPINENKYSSRAYRDLGLAEINQYAPKLSFGYAISYYKQYGNISGLDNQTYTQLTNYPYFKFSLAFNLGGREIFDSNKNKQISDNYLELSKSSYNLAQRELTVSLAKYKYNSLNYQNYKSLKEQSLEAIKATQGAMLTGLIDFSLFLNSQSLLFLGIENESNSLIETYLSYFRVKRLTSDFIQTTQKLFSPN